MFCIGQYQSLRKEVERLKSCLAYSGNSKVSTNFRPTSATEVINSAANWQMLNLGKLDLNWSYFLDKMYVCACTDDTYKFYGEAAPIVKAFIYVLGTVKLHLPSPSFIRLFVEEKNKHNKMHVCIFPYESKKIIPFNRCHPLVFSREQIISPCSKGYQLHFENSKILISPQLLMFSIINPFWIFLSQYKLGYFRITLTWFFFYQIVWGT